MQDRNQLKKDLKKLYAERDQCDAHKESSETQIRSTTTTFSNNVNSHTTLQDNVIPNLAPEAKETIDETRISHAAIYTDAYMEKIQSDLTDPKSEIKDLNLERSMAGIRVSNSRAVDNVIAQSLGSLDENMQNSAQSVKASHEQYDEAVKTLLHHVEQGLAIQDKIDEIEEILGDGGSSSGEGGDEGGDKGGDKSEGDDKEGDKDGGSSLIDDFANPNLEQPSYMDPED